MGYPVEQQKYQSLANLHLFSKIRIASLAYKRWLDLETGIAGVAIPAMAYLSAQNPGICTRSGDHGQNHCQSTRQYFIDRQPERRTQSGPFQLCHRLFPDGSLWNRRTDPDRQICRLYGCAGEDRYEARIKAGTEGGSMQTNRVDLIITGADAVTLYFAAATNFINYKDVALIRING